MVRPILTDFSDRRIVQRAAFRRAARLVLRDRTHLQCWTIDLSHSGVGALSDMAVPKGELCAVGFEIVYGDASLHKVQAAALVAHCIYSSERRGFKVGLQFHKPPETLEQAIRRYLNEVSQVFRPT